MDISLFERETGFDLEQDMSFYDENYGNNRYKILNDMSLIEIGARLTAFNEKIGRTIVPEVKENNVYIYL